MSVGWPFSSASKSRYALLAILSLCAIIFVYNHFKTSEPTLKLTSEMDPEMARGVPGGLGGVRQSDNDVLEAVNAVKAELETKTSKKFDSLDVIHYKPQVVAGTNFFVKVRAKTTEGLEEILHLRIYRTLQRTFELSAFELQKTDSDELKYFQ